MYLHNAHLTIVNNLKLENENVQLFSDVYYGEQNTVPVRMSLWKVKTKSWNIFSPKSNLLRYQYLYQRYTLGK